MKNSNPKQLKSQFNAHFENAQMLRKMGEYMGAKMYLSFANVCRRVLELDKNLS